MNTSISPVISNLLPSLIFGALMLVSPPALAKLDLDLWDALLDSAVDNGYVEYHQWDNNQDFDALVEQIANTDTADMTAREKLVFYINAYNILAARGILGGGSPSSLLGRHFYFKRDKYRVAGEEISLHELEHEWIRPLKEPRIHFAIVCASQSCPILQNQAYRLHTLDAQLEAAAIDFINDPERNNFDIDKKRARLSSIFDWFEEDFVDAAGSVQAYLTSLIEDPAVKELLMNEGFQIKYLKYDWQLNGKR
jgi:hypothetical protein